MVDKKQRVFEVSGTYHLNFCVEIEAEDEFEAETLVGDMCPDELSDWAIREEMDVDYVDEVTDEAD